MLFLWPGQPLPGALMWFVFHQIHFDRSRQHQPVLQFIPTLRPRTPMTISGTDLSFHVWSDGNGGPDGRVDAKKHQPDEHASPDSQVTELQEETDTQAGLSAGPGATWSTPPPRCYRSPRSMPLFFMERFLWVTGHWRIWSFSFSCLRVFNGEFK